MLKGGDSIPNLNKINVTVQDVNDQSLFKNNIRNQQYYQELNSGSHTLINPHFPVRSQK